MVQALHRYGQRLSAIFQFEAGVTATTLHVTLFLVLLGNLAFWQAMTNALGQINPHNLMFISAMAVLITALTSFLLAWAGFRYVFKPVLVVLLLSSAAAGYFMQTYGVMLDAGMIQNILETDAREATHLMTPGLFVHVLLWGVLPVLVLLRTRIIYKPWHRQLLTQIFTGVASLAVLGLTLFLFYKDFASFGRNHHELRNLINPVNYVNALRVYATDHLSAKRSLQPVGEDAHLLAHWQPNGKKNLVILVLGETARASNFSLNGYGHDTNPKLSGKNVINFSNTWSCGTATAASVPCMFSGIGRDNYDSEDARYQENLLDVLQHAGVKVAWRDNNSGCKGVCARVETLEMQRLNDPKFCKDGECHDDILFQDLQAYVDQQKTDTLIVLHQQGSHGPSYHLRYPKEFAVFQPFCDSNDLESCTREEIVNVYDNTILYTDHVLNHVIEFLQMNSQSFNTAMVYMSDHGESLGENGVYLHGLPYLIAPDDQKHVPFIVWLSDQFKTDSGIDEGCLKARSHEQFSHDNLFHSVLGLMDVDTAMYRPGLDVFAPCDHNASRHIAHLAAERPVAM